MTIVSGIPRKHAHLAYQLVSQQACKFISIGVLVSPPRMS